jgi:hypothetical protein
MMGVGRGAGGARRPWSSRWRRATEPDKLGIAPRGGSATASGPSGDAFGEEGCFCFTCFAFDCYDPSLFAVTGEGRICSIDWLRLSAFALSPFK